MSASSNKSRDFFYIALFSIVLFLLIDFFAGSKLLSIARKELPKDKFRIPHDIYHHTLMPNFNGIGHWGSGDYQICTNGSGFKDRCDKVGVIEKSFDIAFIGDSFTEGIGMPYEDSFVGMIANKYPDLKIANLGVVSYAPSIYLAKLKEFYKQGYTFKNVIVFIDIGDLQDEALTYEVVNGKVLSRHEQMPNGFFPKIRRYASRLFPLTGYIWNKIKVSFESNSIFSKTIPNHSLKTADANDNEIVHLIKQPSDHHQSEPKAVSPLVNTAAPVMPNAPREEASIYEPNYTRSAWTFNTNSSGYGREGVLGSINKMQSTMIELFELIRANGSTLSIGVYPWPGQIMFDVEESLQVKIWENFCLVRCKYFYNSFPAFFNLKKQLGQEAFIYKYYMGGDMHFNSHGNQVIADTVINEGVK